jgi:predicted transcriptional regulator
MSEKPLVLEAIRKLPEDATFEDIAEAIAIAAAVRRGEAAADAGKIVSHEEVRKRLASWLTR